VRVGRVAAGLCGLAALALAALGVATAPDDVTGLALLAAVAAGVGLAFTLAGQAPVLTPAVAGLVAPALLGEPGPATGIAAALMVALVELAGWVEDARSVVPLSPAQVRRRAARTLGLAAGAAAVAYGLVLVAEAPPPRGAWAEISGLIGVVGIAAIAAAFAGRRSRT
jgi:hypothetical protein